MGRVPDNVPWTESSKDREIQHSPAGDVPPYSRADYKKHSMEWGGPVGLIEGARMADELILVSHLTPRLEHNVLVNYNLGPGFKRVMGAVRFVRFRRPFRGFRYALVES